MANDREILNRWSRAAHGVTVSFSTDTGLRKTFESHEAANQLEALRDCCNWIDRYASDGPWYVDAISTPQTIYDDVTYRARGGVYAMWKERSLLRRIGRTDLLREPTAERSHKKNPRAGKPGHGWRNIFGGGFERRRKHRRREQ